MQAAGNIMDTFVTLIIDPAILIVFSAGFFLFIYGLVEFLYAINQGGDNTEGKQHMVWGIVGMLIMISVYGIIALLDNTFGLDVANPDVSRINNVTAPADFF